MNDSTRLWEDIILNGITVSKVQLFKGGYRFRCAPNEFAFDQKPGRYAKVAANCHMRQTEGVYVAFRCDKADQMIRHVVTQWRKMMIGGGPRALGIDTEGNGPHLSADGQGIDETKTGPSVVQIAYGNLVLVISLREYVDGVNSNHFPQMLKDFVCQKDFLKVYTGDDGEGEKMFDAMGLQDEYNKYVWRDFLNLRRTPDSEGGYGFAKRIGFYFNLKTKMYKKKGRVERTVQQQVSEYRRALHNDRIRRGYHLCKEDIFYVYGHSVSYYPCDANGRYDCEWRSPFLRLEKAVYAAIDAEINYLYYVNFDRRGMQ